MSAARWQGESEKFMVHLGRCQALEESEGSTGDRSEGIRQVFLCGKPLIYSSSDLSPARSM